MINRVSKYGNKKIVCNGETFDSKKEYNRYTELQWMEKAKAITDLKRQVKYILIPAQRSPDGKVIERECSYKADFVYTNDKNNVIVEDTKGMRTKDYIIKRKLMLFIYGIRINEI